MSGEVGSKRVMAHAPISLVLYGRDYCSLCRQMHTELCALCGELAIDLQWFDIEDDDAVEVKFGDMVPVLVGAQGEVICCYHLNRAALDAYIAQFR